MNHILIAAATLLSLSLAAAHALTPEERSKISGVVQRMEGEASWVRREWVRQWWSSHRPETRFMAERMAKDLQLAAAKHLGSEGFLLNTRVVLGTRLRVWLGIWHHGWDERAAVFLADAMRAFAGQRHSSDYDNVLFDACGLCVGESAIDTSELPDTLKVSMPLSWMWNEQRKEWARSPSQFRN